MGSAFKNIDALTGLHPRRPGRALLRAADAVHWRDTALRGASRAGARLRTLGAALLARQRLSTVVADAITLWPAAPAAVDAARPRALRVLHVVDGTAGSSVGRLVISGRMADVCAELDRLATASEARQLRHG